MMRSTLRNLWLLGLVFVTGCNLVYFFDHVVAPAPGIPNHHVTTASYEGVIFDMENAPSAITTNWDGDRIEHYWTPYTDDIAAAEAQLVSYLRGAIPERDLTPGFWDSLASYKRQYFGVFQATAPYLWINFFCRDDYFPDWQTMVVGVDDGGICFFSVWYDVTKQEFFDLQINGIA